MFDPAKVEAVAIGPTSCPKPGSNDLFDPAKVEESQPPAMTSGTPPSTALIQTTPSTALRQTQPSTGLIQPLKTSALRVRWLGRVKYQEALALQRALFVNRNHEYLLLLEHNHVVTVTRRTPAAHLLADIAKLGAEVVETDRGGDVTYHGPGQLVAYPIVEVPGQRGGGLADTAKYVYTLEQIIIESLRDVGVEGHRLKGLNGVWVSSGEQRKEKIAAVGVRISRGRAMHGVAINVNPDLSWFTKIVPCGIADRGVTSLSQLGKDISMAEMVEVFARRATTVFAKGKQVDEASVGFKHTSSITSLNGVASSTTLNEDATSTSLNGVASSTPPNGDATRPSTLGAKNGEQEKPTNQADGTSQRILLRLAEAGAKVDNVVPLRERKPEWMRIKFAPGPTYNKTKARLSDLNLVTVCEEAGCPNISECWNDGTATFMILGSRCTRACGFCLVDTRHPLPPDPGEADRVAKAVEQMGLRHAVVTMVARDDLADGGASAVAQVIEAIRQRNPKCDVETLISDLKGQGASLQIVFDAEPDILAHNIETVARLQRAVRPSASYARSLSVLAQAKSAGLATKSSIIAGMGETNAEVRQTLIDLSAIGVDIVTIGQYLRPRAHHLPVDRWWPPEQFLEWKQFGESVGLTHVESSPLTRSSYHARQSASSL